MYKPLADSTLMAMTKKEIIEHLRVAEYNHKVCEEQIDQQYRNFIKLLADAERDFQNSDYWNDYLAKVIADARAEEREKFAEWLCNKYEVFEPEDDGYTLYGDMKYHSKDELLKEYETIK